MINIYPSCWYEDHIRSTRSVDELDLLISRFLVFDVSHTPCQSCRWWESWKTYHTWHVLYIYLQPYMRSSGPSVHAWSTYKHGWSMERAILVRFNPMIGFTEAVKSVSDWAAPISLPPVWPLSSFWIVLRYVHGMHISVIISYPCHRHCFH